jgi:hypothetical protein
VLIRRSQKHAITWDRFGRLLKRFPLPRADNHVDRQIGMTAVLNRRAGRRHWDP